jgi:hypothetical protein
MTSKGNEQSKIHLLKVMEETKRLSACEIGFTERHGPRSMVQQENCPISHFSIIEDTIGNGYLSE